MQLPIEFKKLKPVPTTAEKKLVKQGWSYEQIVKRREQITERRQEAISKAHAVRMAKIGYVKADHPRHLGEVKMEELGVIEEDYVQRDVQDQVTVKLIAEKYNIWPAELDKFALSSRWEAKRIAWQKQLELRRGQSETPNKLAERAGKELLNKMNKEEQNLMDKWKLSMEEDTIGKSTQRRKELFRIRWKLGRMLKVSDADLILYQEDPKRLIKETEGIANDPVQAKVYTSLIAAYRNVVDMERQEDGIADLLKKKVEKEQEPEEMEKLAVSFPTRNKNGVYEVMDSEEEVEEAPEENESIFTE